MVYREEPRLYEIKQGIDLLAKELPRFNFKESGFQIGIETGINKIINSPGGRYAQFVGVNLKELVDIKLIQEQIRDGEVKTTIVPQSDCLYLDQNEKSAQDFSVCADPQHAEVAGNYL